MNVATPPTLWLQKYFLGQVIDLRKIEQAKEIYDSHVGPGLFNYDGWKHILDCHDGFLPLRIKAVPEGTVLPTRNGINLYNIDLCNLNIVLFTVENTCPDCYWLTTFVEVNIVCVIYCYLL